MIARPFLVGESNPYGSDPAMALYPLPEGSSGARLCAALEMHPSEYLANFERRNLLLGEETWSESLARWRAARVHADASGLPIILLGRRVARAFGLGDLLFFERVDRGGPITLLPHPSGRCRVWCEAETATRARKLAWAAVAQAAKLEPRDLADEGCPECSFEQLHGRVGEYEQHTCEAA
jgi:hypothetical protein